uniref:hypothetical protein n=2 Tax=Mycobacterium avium TaxID=1764 RepID=UPI001E58F084
VALPPPSGDATPDADSERVSPAGTVYQQMVGSLLAAEHDRRTKTEGRGSTIVTTSSSLRTVVFGLTVVVTGKDYVFANCYAVWVLIAALGAFVISAVLGLVVSAYSFRYKTVSLDFLRQLEDRDGALWKVSADQAVNYDVQQQVTTICSLRGGNERKADLVVASLVFQVAAVALLALSVGLEIYGRMSASQPPGWSEIPWANWIFD